LGSNGLFHASLPGQCLPSETAHFLLFGYDLKSFPGRGLLEAVGEGVAFADNEVLCLAHLSNVTWQDGVAILTQGRDEIEGGAEELEELFRALTPYETKGIGFRLHLTGRNDSLLILSGQASPYVSDSDPIVTGRAAARIFPLSNNPESEKAEQTATAFNEYLTFCHKVLADHEMNRLRLTRGLPPANFLATHRCGRRIFQEPFEQRWGLSAMLIASGLVYGGLAHELGMTLVRVQDSDRADEDLRARIRVALRDDSHDFIHVHTKVPDEAAHKGDPEAKRVAIEALDRGLSELVEAVEKLDDLLVVITGDHSTPSISTLIHSGEPLPLMLVGPNVRRDDVASFDEISAAKGCLGLLRGRELMYTILNYADRSSLRGHRLGSTERPYVPKIYEPFKLTE
jgi:2,3-bisphosphoglycerate-independent phosphoglycerate mutase